MTGDNLIKRVGSLTRYLCEKEKQELRESGIPPIYAYAMRTFFRNIPTHDLRRLSRILLPYRKTEAYEKVNISDISRDRKFRRHAGCNLLEAICK